MRKFLFFLPVVGAFFSCGQPSAHHLKGKWSNIEVHGSKTYEFVAIFREDGTYDGVLNGKVLVSGGHYKEFGDTVSFQDAICNAAYTGTYRVVYKADSVS